MGLFSDAKAREDHAQQIVDGIARFSRAQRIKDDITALFTLRDAGSADGNVLTATRISTTPPAP